MSSSSDTSGKPAVVISTHAKTIITPPTKPKASKKISRSSSGRELPTVNEWESKLMGKKGKLQTNVNVDKKTRGNKFEVADSKGPRKK